MTNVHSEHVPNKDIVILSYFSEMYNDMIKAMNRTSYDFNYNIFDANPYFHNLFTASDEVSWKDRIKNNRIFSKVNSTTKKIFNNTKRFFRSKDTMISACMAFWSYSVVGMCLLSLIATSWIEVAILMALTAYFTYAIFTVILTLID
jgi:hypothetical protein